MSVAPLPIVPLCPGVLPVVPTIGSVLNHEITPVRAVFAIVPVVVVTMVSIKDSNLHACLLRIRAGHGYRWCGNGSAQKQQAEVSVDVAQDRFLPFRELQIEIPGNVNNVLVGNRCMYRTVRILKLGLLPAAKLRGK
jgi:hypothetical protein